MLVSVPLSRTGDSGIEQAVEIHDLDVFRAFRRPHKAHSPLIAYADAVLPFPVAGQDFGVRIPVIYPGPERGKYDHSVVYLTTWNRSAMH